jgi:hypothetical protein
MINLTIYNDDNSQEIVLSGLVDTTGTPVTAATITGSLTRSGVALAGGSLAFAAVGGTPGSYLALLNGFDAPPGRANLDITGSKGTVTFNLSISVTIAERSL